MSFWFYEDAAPGHRLAWRMKRLMHTEETPFQKVALAETETFGKALILDGIMQTTVGDGHIYHEMICLVPLVTHPRPRDILVIGGGDMGCAKTLLSRPDVQTVTVVEIDRRVVELCETFLPEIGQGALQDPRCRLVCKDGQRFLEETTQRYDIIVVDSTDPEGDGPGLSLFSTEFQRLLVHHLRDQGMIVKQTGCLVHNPETLQRALCQLGDFFPLVRPYWASVPSYPGGPFSFVVASLGPDPLEPARTWQPEETRYYTPSIHAAAFALPAQFEALVRHELGVPDYS